MKFLKFLFSLLFLKHLAIALGIFLVLVTVSLLTLNIYTYHGRSYPVPDFTGLVLAEVEELCEKNHLKYEVTDSVFTDRVKRGSVYEQNPRPGFHVKKHRTLFLTMNAVFPDSVRMPDLIGMSLRQARTVLENSNLKIGRLRYLPDYAINNVLEQRSEGMVIEPGALILKGAVIDLDLGRGLSDEKTVTPNLIGMTFRKAEQSIFNASLNLGAVSYDQTILDLADSNNAFVWRQMPVYHVDERVSLGTPVYLWLTLDSLKLPVPDTSSLIYQDQDNDEATY